MKEFPSPALICAARHFVAAHESACSDRPVDFGEVCVGCSEWESCKGDWIETAAPIFDAAGIQPKLIRDSGDEYFVIPLVTGKTLRVRKDLLLTGRDPRHEGIMLGNKCDVQAGVINLKEGSVDEG